MNKHSRFVYIYYFLCALFILFAYLFWPNNASNIKSFFFALLIFWSLINIIFTVRLSSPKKDLIQDVLTFPGSDWDEVDKKLTLLIKNNHQLKDDIEKEKSKFELFIKSFPSPVFILNNDQQFIFLNNRLRELFHFHEQITEPIHLLQVLRDHELDELTQNARKLKNVQTKELSFLPINDQNRQYYTIFTSYLPSYGAFEECVIGFLIETTEQKLTHKMREEFVANVSHELRTPLTILMGQLQLLERKISNIPDALELSNKIQHNSKRLLSMMNELLELSKLESQGRIIKENIEIDILIESILFDLNDKYKDLNIEMLTCFDSNTAFVNAKLFDQLMINLLENAFKYNKKNGKIHVHVFQDDNSTKIIISDTGIGIPEGQVHRIFERFFRVDSSRSSEIQGTGLGLSVVKHIVQKHLGQIKVTSSENDGTTFEISLPRV